MITKGIIYWINETMSWFFEKLNKIDKPGVGGKMKDSKPPFFWLQEWKKLDN
jgi:hypothetical protein